MQRPGQTDMMCCEKGCLFDFKGLKPQTNNLY